MGTITQTGNQTRGIRWWMISTVMCIALLGACNPADNPPQAQPDNLPEAAVSTPREQAPGSTQTAPVRPAPLAADYHTNTINPRANATRRALFGDLHIHTRYSFDAFAFGTIATPSDAYRYAKGEAIRHPNGFDMQLKAPLDFYAVTDHAMFLGAVPAAADTSTEFSRLALAQPFHNLNRADNLNVDSAADRGQRFSTFIPNVVAGLLDGSVDPEMLNNIARQAWADTISAAQIHNDPGKFTTFVAYEYTTTTDERGNLHRNVIFKTDDRLPEIPFSRFHSQNPEGLWAWMDELRAQGIDSVAIPHNSNGSNGAMFMLTDWAGKPIDATYARTRMRNEPLVEVTQVKGTSDTHPALSPNDEWADFEIMPYRVATTLDSKPGGSYVREAYLNGLAIEASSGANPYKFGLIGASDTHTGAGSFDESNFFSKVGILDATPTLRGAIPLDAEALKQADENDLQGTIEVSGRRYRDNAFRTWSASGLAGVWAQDNTRESIFSAFRRKETFATSGPRLQVRLFAGYPFDEDIIEQADWVEQAYASGVPMGGDLIGRGTQTPKLIVWAAQDALSAPLQRLQVIKGSFNEGELTETLFDVACADGLSVDPQTHRCPDNGAEVDLATCDFSRDKGDAELASVWTDPDFNPAERAFYYVRVLENPTCRWSTWDAVRAGVAPRADLHATLQERAWSSPIWYVPQ
ncbi:MAG: DUF3604 domain-containing protein [bacterium]